MATIYIVNSSFFLYNHGTHGLLAWAGLYDSWEGCSQLFLKGLERGVTTKWKDKLTLTYKQLKHGSFLLKKGCVIVTVSILVEHLIIMRVFQFFGYLKYFKMVVNGLFSLFVLFSQFRPHDVLQGICLYTYSRGCTCIRRDLKESVLWGTITWSKNGKTKKYNLKRSILWRLSPAKNKNQ